ncbi:hypothetical protein JN535_12390 [Cellulosimicrobium cellulans]|uniref:hypothetical protein n=1 Tax=Cellulosimicrobium cellulans TaxID=1710 RepID=UPI001964C043|nr:hypothetical protein [Cellulosimicrobium cellulans]MBN0040965.1 hypothetical protein [Cellulosimicrobium cellulans]
MVAIFSCQVRLSEAAPAYATIRVFARQVSGRRAMKRLVKIVATALTAAALGLSLAPPASAEPNTFLVKSRFDPTIYEISVDESGAALGGRTALTYAEWVARGRQTAHVLEPEYAGLPWSSTIYAVTNWPGETWADVRPLTYAEWVGAGRPPADRSFPFCERTWCSVTRYPTSSELFVDIEGSGGVHKLTYSEWTRIGAPEVSLVQTVGYYRLAWNDRVFAATPISIGPRSAYDSDVYATGRSLTPQEWRASGSPTPKVVPSAVRERFVVFAGSRDVYYDGPAGFFPITYQQWKAAGSPPPSPKPFGPPVGGIVVASSR